jgi:CheY-like chemotaxis protein
MQFYSAQKANPHSHVSRAFTEISSPGILASTWTGFSANLWLGGDDGPPSRPLPGRGLPGKNAPLGKLRILVVDDERIIADTVAEILNDSGFVATPAYNGMTAMRVIEQDCPDVVLTDVIMPGINGVELAKFVANTCRDTKVLLFSGQAAVSNLLRQVNELGYSFELLAKPLHPDELIEKLRSLSRLTE